MLVVAVAGATANLISLLILRSARGEPNVQGAYLEVLGDLIVRRCHHRRGRHHDHLHTADIIALVGIGLHHPPRMVALRDVPNDAARGDIPGHWIWTGSVSTSGGVPGVPTCTTLHAWTITSGVPVLSMHVVVDEECIDTGRTGQVLDQLAACLGEHLDTDHCLPARACRPRLTRTSPTTPEAAVKIEPG